MIHGIINIYKEKGYTSHDVVAKMRGILKQKKIGHTGTLDPDAQGVLPVCLGKGTKLCDMLTDKDKTYRAVMKLGVTTDTQDISGQILAQQSLEEELTDDKIREAVLSFVGEYQQIPPMYSALKVNGKKLYELARAGIEVERKPRPVTIYSIEIEDISTPYVSMTVCCSKGTYIRTLCHDIGQKLGTGACMESLVRTRVSIFSVEESIPLARLEELRDEGRLEEVIQPIDAMFLQYPEITVRAQYHKLLYNGNPFTVDHIQGEAPAGPVDGQAYRVYDGNHQFVGIYKADAQGIFRVVRFFMDV